MTKHDAGRMNPGIHGLVTIRGHRDDPESGGMMAAAAVASAGLIGFVGLIVPHLMRLLVGPDHRRLLPASALGGACLLVLADTGARSLVPAAELPVGILTALLGAPFFVAVLLRERRRFWT